MGNATEEMDEYYRRHPRAEKPKYIEKWIKDQEAAKAKGKHTFKRRMIIARNNLKIRDFAYAPDNPLHRTPDDPPKPDTILLTKKGMYRSLYWTRTDIDGNEIYKMMEDPEYKAIQEEPEEIGSTSEIEDIEDAKDPIRSIRLTKAR